MIDPQARRSRRFVLPAVAIAGIAIAGAVLYGRTPLGTKRDAAACAHSAAVSRKIVPLQQGEVAAMNSPATVAPMPALAFAGPDGQAAHAGRFPRQDDSRESVGDLVRAVPPGNARHSTNCRRRPDRRISRSSPINIDTTRLERPKAFLDEVGVKSLAFYADPKADVFYRLKQAGKIVGLPTTFLVGPDGCEIGTLAGGANWGSEDALNLVKGALGS